MDPNPIRMVASQHQTTVGREVINSIMHQKGHPIRDLEQNLELGKWQVHETRLHV